LPARHSPKRFKRQLASSFVPNHCDPVCGEVSHSKLRSGLAAKLAEVIEEQAAAA
jgi:hypothetical protein